MAVLLLLASSLQAEEVLDNAAVVKMVRAGLSIDVVMAKVASSQTGFDTSVDALIDLKSQGVPDPLIKAMVLRDQSKPVTPVTQNPAPPASAPAELCENVEYYTLGQRGWDWQPALLCAGAAGIEIDEQNIPWDQVKAHCFSLSLIPKNEHEWWLSDVQDVYKFRSRGDELQKISDSIKRMHSAVPNGTCSDRAIRKVMTK